MADHASVPTAPSPDPAPGWSTAGRRILTVAAWATGVMSLATTILFATSGDGGMNAVFSESGDDPTGSLGGILMVAGPVLVVVALNLLVWRALLPALARRSAGSRAGLIIGTTVSLALGSVLVVAALLLAGFFALTVLGG